MPEPVKHLFEKAYKDRTTKNTATDSGVKYSVTLGKFADIAVDVEAETKPYEIKSYNDYVGVQNTVYNKLIQDGFFDEQMQRREVENADTGIVVEIGWRGIKETFGKGKRFEKLPAALKKLKVATVKHLPEIIRYGEVISQGVEEYHTNNSDLKYTYIQHPITVDGKQMYVVVDIRQSRQKDMFWVRGVYVDKKSANSLTQVRKNPDRRLIRI